MEKVNLYNAFYWDCPNCTRRNFAIGIPTELSKEEYMDAKEVFGEIDRSEFFRVPVKVACETCGLEYESESPDGDPGENIEDFNLDGIK